MVVKYIESLLGESQTIELEGLVDDISGAYDDETGDGRNYYERFDMVKEEWKVHFDFDKKMNVKITDEAKKKYYDKILEKLNYIFDTKDTDWANSEDSRFTYKKDKTKIYKVSFHFILINKKTTYNYLFPLIKSINKLFKADGIEFDTSIYRNGETRFRIVCCKKDGESTSLLKPITYTDDIKKHILQDTEGCENLIISDDKLSHIKNSIPVESTIKDITSKFKVSSVKVYPNGTKVHNVDDDCPFNGEHKSNHCYIIETEGSLELKCHDEKCEGKVKILFRENNDYKPFNLDCFNAIGKGSENYVKRRKYFEKHYIYVRKDDTMYNIVYRKNSIGCYERELMEVKERGLTNLQYQAMELNKEGNEVLKTKKFMKYYHDEDQYRTNYNYVDFIPDDNKTIDVYNLFRGFNYDTILEEDDITDDNDKHDLDFLLSFLKNNVCENDDKIFHYFISNLALIIQKPKWLNHIITLFYSSEEGTGKSSFLKFFSKVLGEIYTFFGSITDITEKHSTAPVGRLINVIEELKSNKDSTELLKNYSQREKAPINEKNKTINTISCFIRYFIASNLRKCISLKKGERRYFIVKFNKITDHTVINKMDNIYQNKKVIYLFGEYLKNYKLSEEQLNDRKWWEKSKPITATYKLFINNDNLCVFLRELYNRIGYFNSYAGKHIVRYEKNGTLRIPKTKLWELYNSYMIENDNGKYKGKADEFHKKILEDHHRYVTLKKSNVLCYNINLEALFNNMDMDDTE